MKKQRDAKYDMVTTSIVRILNVFPTESTVNYTISKEKRSRQVEVEQVAKCAQSSFSTCYGLSVLCVVSWLAPFT